MKVNPTRAAVLTPAGRGAIASVAVDGPHAVAIIASLFRSASGRHVTEEPTGRILYGAWSTTGEDVVVSRRGESRVEIHSHGGAAASQAILDALTAAGCQIETWQDFIRADEPTSIRAAARIALAAATTERTAAILLDQYQGALDVAVEQAIREFQQGDSRAALIRLRELLRWANFGAHLTSPWQVAIAGPPNVGKSTLINALVGYERAIVFDQPGTTRDIVTAQTAIDGWPIELADSAGLRSATDSLEEAGVARAQAQLQAADLAILVFDVTRPWTDELQQLALDWPHSLLVHNKADLLPTTHPPPTPPRDRPAGMLASAKSGWNVPALLHAIVERLVPSVPCPGAPMPFNSELSAALQTSLDQAERGLVEQAVAMLARLVAAKAGE